jgi:metal-dependent HD superfamily phosphatase/phosphodiesterase
VSEREKEAEVYDEVTRVFDGVPAAVAIPVLVEALVHAINCADPDIRADMTETAIRTIGDCVDLDRPTVYASMQ